jgi:cytochrome c-type biogenesis protein CcmH
LFWFLTVCLFFLATLFVLLPMWRHGQNNAEVEAQRRNELREEENLALYRERVDELDTERAVGNLDQAQYDALLVETQQSLLSDMGPGETEQSESLPKEKKKQKDKSGRSLLSSSSSLIPIVMIVLIPVLAYGLYNQWGYIGDVELMGLFERTASNADDPQEAQALIIALGGVVQADEENNWAWYFLGRNFTVIGMYDEAEIAYERASNLMEDTGDRAVILGQYAQIKYINAGGEITPEVNAIIEQARAIMPNELSVIQLLALDAEQREDYSAAIANWRLLIQANPNSQQANELRANITEAQRLLSGTTPDIDSGPAIDVQVTLGEGLQIPSETRVFIAARNAASEGLPPVAAIDLTVGDLPITIRLDNSSSPLPQFNFSSAESVFISALVSFSGAANPQSGDYRVVSESFSHNDQHVVIELSISERLP